jgi:hypothetical protein
VINAPPPNELFLTELLSWSSLMTSERAPVPILQAACVKLCNALKFDPEDSNQALAVLGQRFILDIAFGRHKSIDFQQKAVSSHLRICLDTTEDRIWQTTMYPSEPLLSCAAAQLLHPINPKKDPFTCLQLAIHNGLVDLGLKGELVSRIIYLIGKDLAVRTPGLLPSVTPPSEVWEEEMLDCRPLRVVDYLGFLFNNVELNKQVKALFDGWYIDFSHWIAMSEPITFPKSNGVSS